MQAYCVCDETLKFEELIIYSRGRVAIFRRSVSIVLQWPLVVTPTTACAASLLGRLGCHDVVHSQQ